MADYCITVFLLLLNLHLAKSYGTFIIPNSWMAQVSIFRVPAEAYYYPTVELAVARCEVAAVGGVRTTNHNQTINQLQVLK